MLNAPNGSFGNRFPLITAGGALVGCVLAFIVSVCGCNRTRSATSGVEHFDKSNGGNRFIVVTVDLRVANLQLFWKKPDGSRFESISPAFLPWFRQRGSTIISC